MSWGQSRRPRIKYGTISYPNPREGSDGDIQINQTNLGAHLFGKIGGSWYGAPLTGTAGDPVMRIGTKLENHLSISQDKLEFMKGSKSMLSITSTGDINMTGKIILTSIGTQNVCIGTGNSDAGDKNVAIGVGAGASLIDHASNPAQENVAIGTNALNAVTTSGSSNDGMRNIGIGNTAGTAITTGHRNTCIGGATGGAVGGTTFVNLTTGSFNTLIGAGAGVTSASSTYRIAIGVTAKVSGDFGIAIGTGIEAAADRCVIGRAAEYITVDLTDDGEWHLASDERRKTSIQDDILGLSFINDLKTRTFKWKPVEERPEEWGHFTIDDDGNKVYIPIDTDKVMHGLIAQEVKTALDNVGVTTFGGWKESENGEQRLSKAMFTIPLIKAVQELSAKVDTMQEEINTLKAE